RAVVGHHRHRTDPPLHEQRRDVLELGLRRHGAHLAPHHLAHGQRVHGLPPRLGRSRRYAGGHAQERDFGPHREGPWLTVRRAAGAYAGSGVAVNTPAGSRRALISRSRPVFGPYTYGIWSSASGPSR